MSKQGTRRSSILKRRSDTKERVVAHAQRLGIIGAVLAGVVWVAAWIMLSGAGTTFNDWLHTKMLARTGEMGFRVANIYVEGRQYTDAQSLKSIINVEKGDPLFAFDVDEAQQLMQRLSWVKSADVKRLLPDTIYVGITERKPYALWQRQGRISVIDEEGVVLTDQRRPEFSKLVMLVGEGVPDEAKNFLTMLQAEPMLYNQTEAATLISGRRWDITLKNGIVVKLPEDDLGVALTRLAKAQMDDRLLEKDIAGVDLREANRLIIETKPGAVNDYLNNVTPASGGEI